MDIRGKDLALNDHVPHKNTNIPKQESYLVVASQVVF